jgi:hypothetical protein
MPQNFLGCDRQQAPLLPPSLREWLDDDHPAWLVLDVAGEIDLGEFYAAYRADGHGRAAHDPAMMVALLLYSYASESGPSTGGSPGAGASTGSTPAGVEAAAQPGALASWARVVATRAEAALPSSRR